MKYQELCPAISVCLSEEDLPGYGQSFKSSISFKGEQEGVPILNIPGFYLSQNLHPFLMQILDENPSLFYNYGHNVDEENLTSSRIEYQGKKVQRKKESQKVIDVII
jgi:hypothetical protein